MSGQEDTSTPRASAEAPSADNHEDGSGQPAGRGSASPTAEAEEVSDEYEKALFSAGLGRRYHDKLERHYLSLGWVNKALSAAAGGLTAFVTHGRFDDDAGTIFQFGAALIVCSLTAWQRAKVTTGRVTIHRRLKRRFADLELFLDTHDPALERLREAKKRRVAIDNEAPETLKRVLTRICHNEQLMSWGVPKDEFLHVGPLQALVAAWFNTKLKAPVNQT